MSRTRLIPIALLAALSAALAFVPACSSDKASAAPPGYTDVRQSNATEAELRTVLGTQSDDWAWAGGQFDTPKDQAALARDTPYEFAWKSALTDASEAGAPDAFEMTYLLVFSTPSKGTILRVFTTLTQYTPDANAWQKLVDSGEPITLGIRTATFNGNELTVDGGPHEGQTLTFTLE